MVGGYLRPVGDPSADRHQLMTSYQKRPPLGANVVSYNEGFTIVCSWRDGRGREKTCLLGVLREDLGRTYAS